MMSYIMYDILKPSVFLKFWRSGQNFGLTSGRGARMALIRLWWWRYVSWALGRKE